MLKISSWNPKLVATHPHLHNKNLWQSWGKCRLQLSAEWLPHSDQLSLRMTPSSSLINKELLFSYTVWNGGIVGIQWLNYRFTFLFESFYNLSSIVFFVSFICSEGAHFFLPCLFPGSSAYFFSMWFSCITSHISDISHYITLSIIITLLSVMSLSGEGDVYSWDTSNLRVWWAFRSH